MVVLEFFLWSIALLYGIGWVLSFYHLMFVDNWDERGWDTIKWNWKDTPAVIFMVPLYTAIEALFWPLGVFG